MIMSNLTIILNHIHSRGVTIIRILNHAMLLLEGVPFRTEKQKKEQKEYEETLEDLIIDIASLCSEDDTWDATLSLLDIAGIDISEEYELQRRYMDRLMNNEGPDSKS